MSKSQKIPARDEYQLLVSEGQEDQGNNVNSASVRGDIEAGVLLNGMTRRAAPRPIYSGASGILPGLSSSLVDALGLPGRSRPSIYDGL